MHADRAGGCTAGGELAATQRAGGGWAGRTKHLSDISAESAALNKQEFRLDGGSREGRPVGLTQEAGGGKAGARTGSPMVGSQQGLLHIKWIGPVDMTKGRGAVVRVQAQASHWIAGPRTGMKPSMAQHTSYQG